MDEIASSPVDARVARTRQALRDALLRLIDTRPFEQVTIREIAAEAGIGYATFFRHHPSTEALLHDLAAVDITSLLGRALPILLADDSRAACAALFDYVAAHRTLWKTLLTGGAAAMLRQEFADQARRIAHVQGMGGGRIPDELRAMVAVGATVEILAWWLAQDRPDPIKRMAEILDRLVVQPAIAPD